MECAFFCFHVLCAVFLRASLKLKKILIKKLKYWAATHSSSLNVMTHILSYSYLYQSNEIQRQEGFAALMKKFLDMRSWSAANEAAEATTTTKKGGGSPQLY